MNYIALFFQYQSYNQIEFLDCVNCSYKLAAIVNGSGDVLYYGSPQIIETQITGTGSVVPQ